MNIYLVRHPKVNIDPKEVCYGQAEVRLHDSYIKDFEKIKNSLSHIKQKLIISSPLARCALLAKYLDKDSYFFDKRLMEMNFGDWELKKWEDINKADSIKWTEDIINTRCPNGEAYKNLIQRTKDFCFYLRNCKEQYRNIIIITHKGVILAIIASILNMPYKNAFNIQVSYSSISKIQFLPNYSLVNYINRKCY